MQGFVLFSVENYHIQNRISADRNKHGNRFFIIPIILVRSQIEPLDLAAVKKAASEGNP